MVSEFGKKIPRFRGKSLSSFKIPPPPMLIDQLFSFCYQMFIEGISGHSGVDGGFLFRVFDLNRRFNQ